MFSTHSGALDLLEATGEGVTCYPLTGRLKAYQYNNVSIASAVFHVFFVFIWLCIVHQVHVSATIA